jgi:DNA-binding transcriptional regulator YhcF (GntR family)
MPKLNIRFKAKSSVAKYQQVADHISTQIASGKLKDGDRLPSDRSLATQAGVSRNTIKEAYRVLKDDKLISTLGTLGTIVGRGKSSPTKKKSAGKKRSSQKKTGKKSK